MACHHLALDQQQEKEWGGGLRKGLEVALALADDQVTLPKELLEFRTAGGQRGAGAAGAVVDYPAEVGQSAELGVGGQGVVDDRARLDHQDHRFAELFDEEAVKDQLAAVVGQVEDAFGLGQPLLKPGEVIDRRGAFQAGDDGPFNIELLLGAIVDDVAGDGQPGRGCQGVRRIGDELPQARHEGQGGAVALLLQDGKGVGDLAESGEGGVEGHGVFRRGEGQVEGREQLLGGPDHGRLHFRAGPGYQGDMFCLAQKAGKAFGRGAHRLFLEVAGEVGIASLRGGAEP